MKMFDYLHERLDYVESKMEKRLGLKTKGIVNDYAFMTCVIQVNTLQSGWQKAVLGLLKSKRGVGSFQMNEDGLVRVSGIANPDELLKSLENKGRKAKLVWFQYGQCSDNLFGPSLMNFTYPPPPPRPRLTCSYYDQRPRLSDRAANEDKETWPPLSGADVTCCSLM